MGRKDLDYLQWLQQKNRAYLTVLAVLTFLVSLSFCLFASNPWQPQKESISFLAGHDSNETIAEQQTAEEQSAEAKDDDSSSEAEQKQQAAAPLPIKDTVVKADDAPAVGAAEQPEQQEDAASELLEEQETQQEQAPNQNFSEQAEQSLQFVSLDPTQINGFAAPYSGTLLYAYGVGYDPIYEDYRFHDGLCYQADGESVTAATAGTVQTVALEQQEQLIVQYGDYTIHYSGLQTCDVQVGDTITAGQPIGTAGKYLYVKAYRQ